MYHYFFEKINKINKFLAKLTQRPSGNIQITKLRDVKDDITIDNEEMQRILRIYVKIPYYIQLENLKELDEFFDKHNLIKLKR